MTGPSYAEAIARAANSDIEDYARWAMLDCAWQAAQEERWSAQDSDAYGSAAEYDRAVKAADFLFAARNATIQTISAQVRAVMNARQGSGWIYGDE